MVAITPLSSGSRSSRPLSRSRSVDQVSLAGAAAARLLAALLIAVVLGSLAVGAVARVHSARPGTVSLDGAGPSVAGSRRGPPTVDLPVSAAGARVHVVQPGDTLWTIARSFQPTGDVRPLVARLAHSRGAAPLQPGDRIAMP